MRTRKLLSGQMLLTNDFGDYALLSHAEAEGVSGVGAGLSLDRRRDLIARGLAPGGLTPPSLEAAILRTRKAFLLEGATLHIFVVTLRCDHSCHYCQVSRAGVGATGFDMTPDDAEAALDRVFESPAQALTIEFQGGEPALRFDLVRQIVLSARRRNADGARSIRFTMVSTLHHLSDDDLAFCAQHELHLSTSIDGTAALHDAQRPNPTRDAWARTVEGLQRARAALGHDGVAALPTVTRAALNDPRGLIDIYRSLGFRSIFLRPVSPYGFARKTRSVLGYDTAAFMGFYRSALDYILELNAAGEAIEEVYAGILLRHIWTPFHSGYVDLRSPAGAGLGAMVYNYDGQVYPSDEARMAAETGDRRFSLGPVHRPLEELLASPAMRWLASGAVAEDIPGCSSCAFVPFCGADPVHHAIIHGDPVGDRANSDFCSRHTALFEILFEHIGGGETDTLRTFMAWAFNKSRSEIATLGYIEK